MLQIVQGENDVLTLKFAVHLNCNLGPRLLPILCLMRILVVGLWRICIAAILLSHNMSCQTIISIYGHPSLLTQLLMVYFSTVHLASLKKSIGMVNPQGKAIVLLIFNCFSKLLNAA